MQGIDASAVKGEPGTGYEAPEGKGAFRCGNCRFFRDGSCGQKDMMQRSELPKLDGGRVKVEPDGCCEYVDRIDPASGASRKKFAEMTKARGKAGTKGTGARGQGSGERG